MSVETNPHNYTNMNSIISQFVPARNSPKEISGANGKFLPKPLLFHLRHPNSKKISRVFCEILSPKNSFRKTESALVPPPARILGGQNTKEKCPFLFRRNWSRANPKSKEHFSLVSDEALRGGGGADSFVQFTLEKSSRKVYNYSTIKNVRVPPRRDSERIEGPSPSLPTKAILHFRLRVFWF